MEFEEKKPVKCPDIDVDGNISGGKQFDLDITIPVDDRDFIYGIVKNSYKEPVKNAQIKKENLYLDHYVQIKNMQFKYGLIKQRK